MRVNDRILGQLLGEDGTCAWLRLSLRQFSASQPLPSRAPHASLLFGGGSCWELFKPTALVQTELIFLFPNSLHLACVSVYTVLTGWREGSKIRKEESGPGLPMVASTASDFDIRLGSQVARQERTYLW